MAAYAALLSLMQTIHDIQKHPSPPISLDNQQVESLTEFVGFLQEFLESYASPDADGDEADPLEMRIADAAYAVQDVIESHIVDNIKSDAVDNIQPSGSSKKATLRHFFNCFQSQKNPIKNEETKLYELDLQQVMIEMDLIKKELMKRENSGIVIHEQSHMIVSSSHVASTSYISSAAGNNDGMVCPEDVLLEIKEKLVRGQLDLQTIPIVGMGGIGKTTLAKTLYSDKLIKEYFDICVWATISQEYNITDIIWELLSQATNRKKEELIKNNEEKLSEWSEEELGEKFYKLLCGRRFLIVMDDMWNSDAWDNIQHFFPKNDNGSRVLVTTRLSQLSSQLNNNYTYQMKFLDKASSWELFTKVVFGEMNVPPQELEKIGKEIVTNCRGLPLSIVIVGGLLKKMEHTKSSWESTRKNLTSLVNLDNDKHCLRLLKMSYDHLPVYLKPCFLYMGVFEEDDEIRVSTILKLWVSEGFVKPKDGKSMEATAKKLLKDLIDRNLILTHRLGFTGNTKYCKMHDLLRDLCLNQGMKDGFFHVLGQGCPRGINSKRRVVIPRNALNERVWDGLRSMPHARSVISERCEVPHGLNSCGLLKTLHVYRYGLDKKSYVMNSLVLRQHSLRHLVVDVYEIKSLLSSINLLWNLHTLIICYPYVHHELMAPAQLWKWPHIRHIEFEGSRVSLPDPSPSDVIIMENLSILKGVLNFKFGEEVVKRIPNIKKLEIEYYGVEETGHEDDHYNLSNIKYLSKLESLNIDCSDHGGDVASLHNNLTFPHSLTRLILQVRHDFEWKDVLEKIGSLPLLEKLILDSGCVGGKWEIVEGQFPSLKYLSLNVFDDLKHLAAAEGSSIFPCLEHLHLYELEELKEITCEIGYIPTLRKIELINCKKSAVKCVKKIVDEQVELQGELPFHVEVRFFGKNESMKSFADPNFNITFQPHFSY